MATSELVRRLREHANWSGPVSPLAPATVGEAADRIERLEASLLELTEAREQSYIEASAAQSDPRIIKARALLDRASPGDRDGGRDNG